MRSMLGGAAGNVFSSGDSSLSGWRGEGENSGSGGGGGKRVSVGGWTGAAMTGAPVEEEEEEWTESWAATWPNSLRAAPVSLREAA